MDMMNEDDPFYMPPDLIADARFSWSLGYPGVPFTAVLNSVILLLDTYNVQHDAIVDPGADMAITTGNEAIDERYMNDWMSLKMFLDGLNREYEYIRCVIQGTGIGLHMTFECR